MRFGDRGSLRRAASHLRDEAVATERATRRAGSHLESLVAAAGRYEAPSAHALLSSWQAPASTFRRLIAATDDAATALDDLARALDRAEDQWTSLVHQAATAGFDVSGDGAAVRVEPAPTASPPPGQSAAAAADAATHAADARSHADRLERALRDVASDVDAVRRLVRSRVRPVPDLDGLEGGRGVAPALDTGDDGLDADLRHLLAAYAGAHATLDRLRESA